MKAVAYWVEVAGRKTFRSKSLTTQMGLKDLYLTMLTVTSLCTKSTKRDATFANFVTRHLKQWVIHIICVCVCVSFMRKCGFYFLVPEMSNMRFSNCYQAGYLSHFIACVVSLIRYIFTQQTNILRTHLKTHSDQKNFSCDLCGTSFRTKGSLIRHNRRHTGTAGKQGLFLCWMDVL